MHRTIFLCLGLLSPAQVLADPPPQERQETLRNMLRHDCGACHGLTLKGGLGPALLASDLAAKSDDYLVDTIQNGRKGTAMPPWKLFISEQETLWLVQTILKRH
ncbi:MAG: cytochrome c [Gammaproteobacteria bacterium]|jgi:cytochrome c55X|nr:cytochrome c [Gammaproteobacteria bacterium]MBT5825524.1 cytochrome c [Gammaproteobacteria bacterium]MBT5966705.1 cytochrome c [Gammaproteobacteria bacterium]MBT6419044.1 cytochrome c [Gammaproteobacteria bacterium]MBT6576181.1 cytochrome c [Gammaproteobacteria bacterium]